MQEHQNQTPSTRSHAKRGSAGAGPFAFVGTIVTTWVIFPLSRTRLTSPMFSGSNAHPLFIWVLRTPRRTASFADLARTIADRVHGLSGSVITRYRFTLR